ncbi:RALGAPA2 [Cordylochernes scorpioides]|uniref:RALGAPA2 n=1 Tax=Cordylochernes scorpioides TaxID=51811 RepID=A0ABY6LRH9_9ARAC|nr:RALGAPA2 [Cordylochernes scorpioides]
MDMDTMFYTLVPGLHPKFPNPFLLSSTEPSTSDSSIFYSPHPLISDETSIITPAEITPLIPAQSSELTTEDPTCFYLECLLELMVSQVGTMSSIYLTPRLPYPIGKSRDILEVQEPPVLSTSLRDYHL